MNKGLSFVELLVSVAMFTLVIAGVFSIRNMSAFAYSSQSTSMDLQQQARSALDRMVRELRAATNQPTITMISADSYTISFDTPTVSGVQYSRSGNQLMRQSSPIASNIAFLKFTDLDVSTHKFYQIEVRADKTISGKTYSSYFREKVQRRN